jgi:hypothetical protein
VAAIDSVENGYGDTCLRPGPSIVDEAWKKLWNPVKIRHWPDQR